MAVSDTIPKAPRPRTAPGRRLWDTLLLAGKMLLVRLRFLLLLLAVLLLAAYWPLVRNHWDKLTRPAAFLESPVSLDTEYWCPMCPGVVSDWPSKCPVCNMALVRRKKGEAVPLPDGVVARMQLSPYRIQLAGIRTTPVEYRPLAHELTLAGFVEQSDASLVRAEVFEKDVSFVTPGQTVEIESTAFPGKTFPGRVRQLAAALTPETRTLRVRLEIDNPRQELRPGMFVLAKARVPLAPREWLVRAAREDWRNRTLLDLLGHALAGSPSQGGLGPLNLAAVEAALRHRGLVLAVPENVVIDTGARKVVYVERMPGMFDGVEVTLGQRAGEFYPVLRGVAAGDRVVTAGAFLLDAETRLNPSLAASYFGAGRGSSSAPAAPAPATSEGEELSAADKLMAGRQKVCPVTGEPLDSMGGPVKVVVNGRTVFICCAGCEPALRKNPEKYLAKLPRD
jgi:Cu(I)/Ag(I) efflux system membrane fusion protein